MIKKVIFVLLFVSTTFLFAQKEQLKDSINSLEEIVIQGVRVKKTDPFTQSNLNKKELETRNLGQDIPVLLNYLANVVTTSDAGAGVGYTGIRVRGSDATRVNVTINGIALNDSESQGVYWVNLPDFSSSMGSVQLQRGVGTSSNGAGAFGASLNILTEGFNEHSLIELQNSYGSFNTHKHNLQFQSGKLGEHFYASGRFSLVHTDGYIDRATSDLQSLYLSAAYRTDKTLIKFVNFGGHEKTYQAWYGVDADTYNTQPTFNYAGAIYNNTGEISDYYQNQTDNYTQVHNQLIVNHHVNATTDINAVLHYTRGYGYYEEYKQDAKISSYSLPTTLFTSNMTRTDLIRRKWLSNHYYGATFSIQYQPLNQLKLLLGSALNQYDGDHFGKVIWAKNAVQQTLDYRYYLNNGLKNEFNIFQKVQYQISEQWNIFTDLQYRNVTYKTDAFLPIDVNERYHFFNPKAGITYSFSPQNLLYLSYAQAHKEPVRDDYEMAIVKPQPETLHDFELGWRKSKNQNYWQLNAYYMYYQDQLVLTGAINDEGEFVRANSGESFRLGLEWESVFNLHKKWQWMPTISYNISKNVNFFDDIKNTFSDTTISYSPDWVGSNGLVFKPNDNIDFSFFTKYVGKQYMSNDENSNAVLVAYSTSDFLLQWHKTNIGKLKNLQLKALINNLFNEKVISNGYMYDGIPYYYPQAGIHYLVGVDISF